MLVKRSIQGLSQLGGQMGHAPPTLSNPRHFNFWTKKGSTVSVSNIRDITFYACSEIIWTRNLIVYATIFGQYAAASLFFYLNRGNRSLLVGLSENFWYLTLDLLKSFSLWTMRKFSEGPAFKYYIRTKSLKFKDEKLTID